MLSGAAPRRDRAWDQGIDPAAFAAESFPPAGAADLSERDFKRIASLLYRVCGIDLQAGKQPLVKARLWKRVRTLGYADYGEYIAFVESPAGMEELTGMVDALTTNKTSFFRESRHFDFLRTQVREQVRHSRRVRIWSAGCSSGQEPYTLAITLMECLNDSERRDALILATDISAPILAAAREGRYGEEEIEGLSRAQLQQYFIPTKEEGRTRYAAGDELKKLVRFARLNLMATWPMQGPFDFIFCRNVMIYFDRATQQKLVARFHQILRPGGFLLVGHSESLTGRAEGFTYVMPAVYRR